MAINDTSLSNTHHYLFFFFFLIQIWQSPKGLKQKPIFMAVGKWNVADEEATNGAFNANILKVSSDVSIQVRH